MSGLKPRDEKPSDWGRRRPGSIAQLVEHLPYKQGVGVQVPLLPPVLALVRPIKRPQRDLEIASL